MERVLLTTGGTGGHIFPALAVAEALRQRHPGVELLFVGSQYGPEQRLARAAGIDFIGLPVRGFLGRGLRAFAAAGRMACAVCRARGIIRRFRPQVVAGFGGYAAFAPMLAARLAGVPTVLHEQNAIAGMSFEGVTGNFTLDKKGSPKKSVVVLELKDGKPQYKTTIQPAK